MGCAFGCIIEIRMNFSDNTVLQLGKIVELITQIHSINERYWKCAELKGVYSIYIWKSNIEHWISYHVMALFCFISQLAANINIFYNRLQLPVSLWSTLLVKCLLMWTNMIYDLLLEYTMNCIKNALFSFLFLFCFV